MVTSTSTPGSRLMLVYGKWISIEPSIVLLSTYDLLDDLAGGVEVDQALVDLELVAVPSLRTLTARLSQQRQTMSIAQRY